MKNKLTMRPLLPPKRKSETATHFIVTAWGRPRKKKEFIEWIEQMQLKNCHPDILEFSIFDVSVSREDEQEFLKNVTPLNIVGYFPRRFVKWLQFLLKHNRRSPYYPFDIKELSKLKRSKKHKLLNYYPTLISYRRH